MTFNPYLSVDRLLSALKWGMLGLAVACLGVAAFYAVTADRPAPHGGHAMQTSSTVTVAGMHLTQQRHGGAWYVLDAKSANDAPLSLGMFQSRLLSVIHLKHLRFRCRIAGRGELIFHAGQGLFDPRLRHLVLKAPVTGRAALGESFTAGNVRVDLDAGQLRIGDIIWNKTGGGAAHLLEQRWRMEAWKAERE